MSALQTSATSRQGADEALQDAVARSPSGARRSKKRPSSTATAAPPRANWVPTRAGHFLCVEASLEGAGKDDPVKRDVVARLTAWRDDEVGTLEISGQEDAMLDAAHPARVMLAVRKSPFAYADEDAFCDNLVLLLAVEDSTSTTAIDEAAVVVRFFPPSSTAEAGSEEDLAPLGARAGFPPVDAQDAAVPPWVRRRCKFAQNDAAKSTKVWFLDVRTEHKLCQLREGYRDMVTVGPYRFWLRLHWTVTRSNLSSQYDRVWFMPSMDQEFLREQFMDHVENATRPVPASANDALDAGRLLLRDTSGSPHGTRHQRARLSTREWAIIGWQGAGEGTPADVADAIIEEGQINAGTAALRFVSYLEPHRVAACVPLTLTWIQELARAERVSIVDLLLGRPDLLVLCILMLSKVTDDSLAQDAIGVSMISQEIAKAASEACLASLLEVFSRILANTAAKRAAASSSSMSNTAGDGAGAHIADVAGPNDHTAVVAATGAVVLALLCREEPSSDPEILRGTLDRVLCLICRARDLEVAWAGTTRLFPVCLVACTTSVAARELVALVGRSLRAAKEFGPQAAGLDYWLACVAHLLQTFDAAKGSFVWTRDILPSSEDWVQLHLVRPAVALAVEALERAADRDDQGDGFDALALTLHSRIRVLRTAPQAPTKLDAGLMTPAWAIHETWPLSRALVRLTCKRKSIVSTATLPLLQLLSVEPAPDANERLGSSRMTLLQSLVAGEDENGSDTLETLRMLFECMLVHVSTTYAGPFVPEMDVAKMTAQLVTLLVSLKDDQSEPVRNTWRAAFDLLIFSARTWEGTEHAGWALLTVRELLSSFLEPLVDSHDLDEGPARPIGASPWFASTLAHGLMRVCTTRGVAHEVVDEAVRVLNVLLVVRRGGCRDTVDRVCKLGVLELSRAPRMELDRWLLVLEDLCVDSALPGDLFALHALAKAIQRDPASAALRFDLVERLVGPRLTSVWWPWVPPPPELTQRRRVYDGARFSSDPEIRVLSAACDIHREALGLIDRELTPAAYLLPATVGIQLQVALLLCGALDDLGKDAVVRELEVLVSTVKQVVGTTDDEGNATFERDSQSALKEDGENDALEEGPAQGSAAGLAAAARAKSPCGQYWVRLAAVAIATVEDALKEPLGFLWAQIAKMPPAPGIIALNHAAFSTHGVPARRLVAYDGASWVAFAMDPRLALADVAPTLAAGVIQAAKRSGGLALEWSGLARPGFAAAQILRSPSEPLERRRLRAAKAGRDVEGSTGQAEPALLQVFAAFTVRSDDENPSTLRLFARAGDPDKVFRINLRPGKAGHVVDARGERAVLGPDYGLGASFLGETLHQVSKVEISWAEAAQEHLALSIRFLRACLENDIWLPKEPSVPDKRLNDRRQALFLHMANTVLDATLVDDAVNLRAISREQSRRGGDQDTGALDKLSQAFRQLAEKVKRSLDKNLDESSSDEITRLLSSKRERLRVALVNSTTADPSVVHERRDF